MNKIFKTIAVLVALTLASTAYAQEEGFNALNYMLQRPRVAKQWQKKKKPFDHFFIEGGAGMSIMGSRLNKIGATAEVGIGDWILPEHGVRLNVNGGVWKTGAVDSKYAMLGLDYLLNITAIAQRGRYYTPKRFEVYGIAGVNFAVSHYDNNNEWGLGVHLGLRGQLAINRFAYLYLEPRFGLYEDQISQVSTWRGYRPAATITMGLGYRLPENRKQYTDPNKGKHGFADGLFISALAGPMLAVNAHPSTWADNMGVRAMASLGKWFDPYNAVRLSLVGSTIRPNKAHRVKAVGGQLDYMLNLHNAFGGVDPERVFWVNGVAGISYNQSNDDEHSRKGSWGFGGGLQANVRLSRGLNFVLEPRVDIYTEKYLPRFNTFSKWDVLPSLLAGFTYTYHDAYKLQRRADGKRGTRRASFTVAGGLATQANKIKDTHYWMPEARVSYTQWSRSGQGLRFNIDGMVSRSNNNRRYAKAVAGADWMVDLTAQNYGVDNTQWLSLRTVAGFALGADYGSGKANFASDVHAGGQARIRLSSTTGIIVEPQMAYEFSKHFVGDRVGRLTPRVLVGVDYALNRGKHTAELDDAPDEQNFVDVSGGAGFYTGNFSYASGAKKLTYHVRAGFGHWFNGVHGIYGSASNTFATSRTGKTDNLTAVSVDYMMNLRNAVTGEQNDDKVFQITGLLGAQLGINSGSGHKAKVAPGVNAALQAGFRASRNVEIYLEPSATVYTKSIEPYNGSQPANGELKLSLGLKYHF